MACDLGVAATVGSREKIVSVAFPVPLHRIQRRESSHSPWMRDVAVMQASDVAGAQCRMAAPYCRMNERGAVGAAAPRRGEPGVAQRGCASSSKMLVCAILRGTFT